MSYSYSFLSLTHSFLLLLVLLYLYLVSLIYVLLRAILSCMERKKNGFGEEEYFFSFLMCFLFLISLRRIRSCAKSVINFWFLLSTIVVLYVFYICVYFVLQKISFFFISYVFAATFLHNFIASACVLNVIALIF